MSHNSPFPYPSSNNAPHPPPHHTQPTPTNAMSPSNPAVPPPAAQAQQAAAFLQNAQLGGLDLSVLQNISPEQFAVISQLIQAGLFPLPQAQNPVQPSVPAPAPAGPQSAQQNGAAKPQEDNSMDLDKEEGEWEDGEVAPQAAPAFLRPPPTGPRKRSGSVHRNGNDKRARRQPSPPRQPKGYDRRRPVERQPSDQVSSPPQSPVRQRRAKHDAAKTFIQAVYNAGFTFDDLAREVGDAKMLKVIFKELNLNVPAAETRPAQQQTSATAHAPAPAKAVAQNTIVTPGKTTPGTSPVAQPTAKPAAKRTPVPKAPAPAPVDRSAYLARLQAAKNKKNEASPSATAEPPVDQTPSPAPVQQPRKATIQTDLIRKRLEALKAEQALKVEQARKQEADRLAATSAIAERPKSTGASDSQPESDSFLESPNNTALQHQQASTAIPAALPFSSPQPAITPAQPASFTSQFPGLPGLFMNGGPPAAPTQVTSVLPDESLPAPLPANASSFTVPVSTHPQVDSSSSSRLTSSRSSPHLAFKETAPASEPKSVPSALQSGRATPKHPFNQNKYDSNDDSVIIHVSDEEESELDDDDMDESEDTTLAPAANPPKLSSKPGPLRNFPAQGTSAAASPLTTPGATTPGGTAYQRKLQEIEDMNRRIAEMQKQAKKPKADMKPALPPAATAPAQVADTKLASALPGLPTNGAGASVANATATQPTEPEQTESSQQMEVKLAQLKEEAEMISEQRKAAPNKSTEALVPPQPADTDANGDSASSTSSDEDDDDDAMDLSSGGDSDSESESEDESPTDAPRENITTGNPVQTEFQQAEKAPLEDSDTSDDSDDSSTESEESDDDYEPAPAAPDVVISDTIAAEPVNPIQPANLPGLDATVVSSSPTARPGIDSQDADLAPEIQPSARGEDNATPEAQTHPKSGYKPYESPLRMFKDYRFHPKFPLDVQGGFKSLTYSNKIDPTEFICPNELSEGVCHDVECTDQHFRNMAVSDAELLKDLGTRNAPWTTKEGEKQWKSGLTDIVRQLRDSNQGSDVNVIATHIAQYRREFIGHPDQILHLSRT
ncbi:hypothetical protein Q7P37_011178 [Cladosporium fusiforme]